MEKKYQTGLFIGRFQPFHLGHLSAIKQGLEMCNQMVLVIGSANRNFTLNNPLTISERQQLLEKIIQKESWKQSIQLLKTLDDNPNNLQWVKTLFKNLPPIDVVIGNNNLVTVLTQYLGYKQFHPKLTKREILQGQIIRNRILSNQPWQKRVPQYTLSLLKKYHLIKRLRSL